MADNKKYYYLKLKENFFDSDTLVLLESMPDGYLYSNILLKLYLKSLKNEGKLMFNDLIPFSPQMIASVTRHQVGTIEKALEIFAQLGLIEKLDNGAIFMLDIQSFIGKSSSEGDRKREYRKRIEDEKKMINGQTSTLLGQMSGQTSDEQPPEIEIELEIDKEIDIYKDIKQEPKENCGREIISLPLKDKTEHVVYEKELNEFKELYPAVDIEQELRKMKGWLISNPSKRKTKRGIMRFINNWLSRCQDSGHKNVGGNANGDTRKRDGSMYAEFS